MFIEGKVAPIKQQVLNKLSHGINEVELQLMPGYEVEEVIQLFTEIKEMKINFVHTVLSRKEGMPSVLLNHLQHEDTYREFDNTCRIASAISELQKHPVGIVLHNTKTLYDYEHEPGLVDDIANILTKATLDYPGIYFTIENVTPYDTIYQLCNGITAEDVVGIVELFREKHIYNLFITLDICHIMMTKMFFDKMLKDSEVTQAEQFVMPITTFRHYFETCNIYVRNIHIASCKGEGYLPSNHGTALSEDDLDLVRELHELTLEFCGTAVWTVEVKEEGYSDCLNQVKTIEICKRGCE